MTTAIIGSRLPDPSGSIQIIRRLQAKANAFCAIVVGAVITALVLAKNACLRVSALTVASARALRPVRHCLYLQADRCAQAFQATAIQVAGTLESKSARAIALLGIAAESLELRRDTSAALRSVFEVLQDRRYWLRYQRRVLEAVRHACRTAHLAARSGQADLGMDAYVCAQMYEDRIVNVNRKIQLAVMLSDVAAVILPYDQSTWLGRALELAAGIEDSRLRLGAISFVTRKMVSVGIPPATDVAEEKKYMTIKNPAHDSIEFAAPRQAASVR